MLILGSSNDDRGIQLERLTHTLLSNMGYRDVVTNLIGPGGEEIDVSANYPIPSPGREHVRRLICECKAHRRAVDITPWLKFLGKVFVEEACRGQEVYGCFIALSGVNGNVAGNYDELSRHRENVSLITGDRLLEMVSRIYRLSNLEQVSNNLRRFTNRQFRTIEEGYYGGRVYWVVSFEDDAYTILSANGQPLQREQSQALRPLIESAIAVHSYVDLQEEAESHRRTISVQKGIISKLMMDNGVTEIVDLAADLATRYTNFTDEELRIAIGELIQHGWIVQNDCGSRILFHNEDQNMLEIYRFLLNMDVPVRVLGCDYYDAHINNDLVSGIREIQGGLPLAPDDIDRAIRILRWSPRALARVLSPDPMIVTHRRQGISGERIDANDRSYFFGVLFQSLMADFQHPALYKYFFEIRGLRELEISQAITVKNRETALIQEPIQTRLSIGQAADELGGGYVLFQSLDYAPEPWEWPGQTQDDKTDPR